jgi:hypothetical protein
MLVLFGAAGLVSPDQQGQMLAALCGVAAIVLTGLAVLAWLRGPSQAARSVTLASLLVGGIACAAAAVAALRAETEVPVVHFGVSALAVALLGAWLVERYARIAQGVRALGHLIVAGTVIGLCVDGRALLPRSSTQVEWMVTAALNVAEWLLVAMLVIWAVFVAVQGVALGLGLGLGRGADPAARRSLDTSRLALVGSSALFAMLSLVLWSVVSYVAGRALTDFLYLPVRLGRGYRSAEIFLDERTRELGTLFTPLVLSFTALGLAALLVLVPSLKEELRPTRSVDARGRPREDAEWSARLGEWLGGGLKGLSRTFGVVVPGAAIAGGVAYLAFVCRQLGFAAGEWAPVPGETLVAAGKWLAGGAWTVAALGSRFTQTFGRLRVGIDAALDVDNYFGDPPDRQPPRARIYSRYAALLGYLRDRGYARLVVVSHSQGTVISADLLRYLHVQGRLPALVGGAPIALVTVGSPLRDLYAERFPLLYRWMGASAGEFEAAGPSAADIGAVEWVNAFRSGDYVGRFMWPPSREPYRIAGVRGDGTVEADRAGDRTQLCLGAGAHTHYFSHDAVALAAELDRLIAA